MPRFTDVADLRPYLEEERPEAAALMDIKLSANEDIAERYARRRFCPAEGDPVQIKAFTTRGATIVRIPDLREVVSVNYGGLTLGEDDYDLGDGFHNDGVPAPTIDLSFSRERIGAGWAGTGLLRNPRDLIIEGRWGFKPTPDAVKDAVYMLTARSYRHKDSGYADNVALEGDTVRGYVARVPEAQKMLDHYRMPNLAIVG